ncbi:MAG TPA: hypothetical protein VKJ65_05115 [Phycisphaerae bacterium]|nr:hypothetical protein [Phycisphaerae bacterium]
MKTKIILLALALGTSTCLLTAQDSTPPGDGQGPPPSEGGPGGLGGPRFHVLPPGAKQILKLTPDQLKQVADLEAEVKVKMEKILTPDQLQQLAQMRPPRPPGGPEGGPDGQGGPGGDALPPDK